MDNEIFLTKSVTGPLCLTVGSHKRRHRVWLSDDDALRLAYRLMALAKSGETRGIEQFERKS